MLELSQSRKIVVRRAVIQYIQYTEQTIASRI